MPVVAMLAALLLSPVHARSVELKVTDKGFEPAELHVKKGEPLKLIVARRHRTGVGKVA